MAMYEFLLLSYFGQYLINKVSINVFHKAINLLLLLLGRKSPESGVQWPLVYKWQGV